MASEITVRVGTPHGLADESELLTLLERATGLTWESHEVPIQGLAGVTEIIITAAIQVATTMAFRAAVDKTKQTVEDWRKRRLNAPPTDVDGTLDDTADLG